jgi:hypothetical protein
MSGFVGTPPNGVPGLMGILPTWPAILTVLQKLAGVHLSQPVKMI